VLPETAAERQIYAGKSRNLCSLIKQSLDKILALYVVQHLSKNIDRAEKRQKKIG